MCGGGGKRCAPCRGRSKSMRHVELRINCGSQARATCNDVLAKNKCDRETVTGQSLGGGRDQEGGGGGGGNWQQSEALRVAVVDVKQSSIKDKSPACQILRLRQ